MAALRVGVLVPIVVVAIACGGSGDAGTVSAADVTAGQELFRGTCASCHGQNAEGMPRLGKDLRDNPFVARLSLPELVEFLEEGRPAIHPDNEQRIDMPPKGGDASLTTADLRLIAVYLRSIQ